MSQVSPTRITRAAMKRTLSVGNLDVSIESHPPSIESLFSGKSDKSSRSLILKDVVNRESHNHSAVSYLSLNLQQRHLPIQMMSCTIKVILKQL